MRFSTIVALPLLLAGFAMAKLDVDSLSARDWTAHEESLAARAESLSDFSTRELVEEVLERRGSCPAGFYFDPPRNRCCSRRTNCK
ncbi:hypothetical protein FA15DRAFT_756999 [Coprinopsis marcescibilis]|uniref:Uncharacterized protein n=1 Tax=Coprinopsis marcescibilis TaxID=230819 RepID=A0A5C3KVA2_COPMA|nr:hypothetical protein FA15DRAFT_756999 [Coprinopsis marcescibilis]